MSVIKSLDQNTVHRICSGQVIINLANAVKELIENSLDAGSKNIEIKLKQYGSELIEVIDDGPGIPEADFQTITLKHYTSKIQKYEDLESLGTFGFRGEALSSLCALSNMIIITRYSNSIVGTRLEYDKNGLIKSKSQCARSIGTTVILEKLFHTLPVRYKEFQKNLKKEYHKLMHVIQCYCLISEGVKLSCFNIIADKSTKIMSTHSKNGLKDNIIEIFGINSFNSLVKFEQAEPDEEIIAEFKLKPLPKMKENDQESSEMVANDTLNVSSQESMIEDNSKNNLYKHQFQIEGYISSCNHNQGRSTPDRQYIYVNKRPCDHAKITKLINEIYHQFNRTQYPMFILNINMNSNNVDVNVTPDKLQMFFKNENILLAVLKASLLKIYHRLFKNMNLNESSFANTQKSSSLMLSFFQPQSKPSSQQQKLSKIGIDDEIIDEEEKKENINNFNQDKQNESEKIEKPKRFREEDVFIVEEESNLKFKQPKLSSYIENPAFKSPKSKVKSPQAELKFHTVSPKLKTPEKSPAKKIINQKEISNSPFSNKDRLNFFQNQIGSDNTSPKNTTLNDTFSNQIDLHLCNRQSAVLDTPPPPARIEFKQKNVHENLKILGINSSQTDHDLQELGLVTQNIQNESINSLSNLTQNDISIKESTRLDSTKLDIDSNDKSINNKKTESNNSTQISSTNKEHISKRKEKILKLDLNQFKKNHTLMIEKNQKEKSKTEQQEINLLTGLKFKNKNIESKEAEKELDRCITKEDFLKMKVCGQFNKGFIITQLEKDLFIVDQHAADEIYNFETIQKTGKMEKQKLLQPKYLELPASAESILIDNLNLLEKLGYEVQVCTNRKYGNRIMITCVPMSKQSNRILNMKDIDELLFVLSENELNAGSITTSSSEKSHLTDVKSSSLRSLYASKACRRSVMIGDSLNMSEMKRIITHLNEIDKPWNCPHGRPTMRHLINIDLLKQE